MSAGIIAPALSPASVWATVGVGPTRGPGHMTTILLHWNGTAWSIVPFPKGVGTGGIYGLASDGHGGAWVGSYAVNKPGVLLEGLVMYHFSGGHWTHVAAPVISRSVTDVNGMELIPGTRSVLATATVYGHANGGAILKYGP